MFERRGAPATEEPFRHLTPGKRYRVTRAFHDFDGVEHPVGECWTFVRSTFLPYEDGRSLFVLSSDGGEHQIRLQQRDDAQESVVGQLEDYIAPASALKSIRVTRDSVCMADDIHAPHEKVFELEPQLDAGGVAKRLLSGSYLAYVGLNATWTLALGPDQVVFGLRFGRRFVLPISPDSHHMTVTDVDAVHVHYATQEDPKIVADRLQGDHAGRRGAG